MTCITSLGVASWAGLGQVRLEQRRGYICQGKAHILQCALKPKGWLCSHRHACCIQGMPQPRELPGSCMACISRHALQTTHGATQRQANKLQPKYCTIVSSACSSRQSCGLLHSEHTLTSTKQPLCEPPAMAWQLEPWALQPHALYTVCNSASCSRPSYDLYSEHLLCWENPHRTCERVAGAETLAAMGAAQ